MKLPFLVLLLVSLVWAAWPALELHAQETGRVELCQQMEALRSEIVTVQRAFRIESKPLKADPELALLSKDVSVARQAVKDASKNLKEAMQVYQDKRLEKIKTIPKAESLYIELEALRPKMTELQKQIRHGGTCPTVSK